LSYAGKIRRIRAQRHNFSGNRAQFVQETNGKKQAGVTRSTTTEYAIAKDSSLPPNHKPEISPIKDNDQGKLCL